MAKQQRADARGGGRASSSPEDRAASRPARLERKKRTPPRQFLKEVRTELKKVAWPSRKEVATYTVVVLISVFFVTAVVFGLDYGFNQLVFRAYSK
jgi:preprotein translocase subunit SecE